MKKRLTLFCVILLILMILLASCNKSPVPTLPETGESQVLPSTPAEAERSGGPISSGWEVADQPLIGKEDLALAVHAMEVSSSGAVILYAATGSGVAALDDPGTTILLHDQQGRDSQLVSQETFTVTLGGLRFGRLVFAQRPFGAQELILQIRQDSGKKTILEGVVAQLYGTPEDQIKYANGTYSFNWWPEIDLGSYRIASLGWGVPPQQVAIPTEMLYPKDIGSGEAATLRIEDLQNQQVYYLFMRFPSIHETKVVLIQ